MIDMVTKEGWAFAINWEKAHYIINGRSLCSNWIYLGDNLELGNDNSSDNCKVCARKLIKRKKK